MSWLFPAPSAPTARDVMMSQRKPKNGAYFIALVVGGDKKQLGQLRKRMALRGILVSHHWADGRSLDRKAIPADVEVTLIWRDPGLSRHVRDRIAFNAKKSGHAIQFANISGCDTQLDALGLRGKLLGESVEVIRETHAAPEPGLQVAPNVEAKPIPEELVPEAETIEQKFKRIGKMLFWKRDALKLSAAQVGRAVGCSGSNIIAMEKGRATPSDAMCAAVERYYSLEHGTIPRAAKRQNHKMALPAVKPPGLGVEAAAQKAAEEITAAGSTLPEPPPILVNEPERPMQKLGSMVLPSFDKMKGELAAKLAALTGGGQQLAQPSRQVMQDVHPAEVWPTTTEELLQHLYVLQQSLIGRGISKIVLTPKKLAVHHYESVTDALADV